MIRKCSILISLLFFLALAGWDTTTRAYAQDCQGDLEACVELLDEALVNQEEMDRAIQSLQLQLIECEEVQDRVDPLMIFEWYANLPRSMRIAIKTVLVGAVIWGADQLNIEDMAGQ